MLSSVTHRLQLGLHNKLHVQTHFKMQVQLSGSRFDIVTKSRFDRRLCLHNIQEINTSCHSFSTLGLDMLICVCFSMNKFASTHQLFLWRLTIQK